MKIIVWLLLCVIWGTTWFVIKIGLQDLPPLSFAALRFACAVGILFVILAVRKIRLPKTRNEWTLVAITGLLQFSFNYSAVFWSEQYISSGLAAVLQATIPAFGLLTARLHLPQERITKRKIAAILLGIIGVAVIFINQLYVGSWLAFAGCVAIVAGAFAAAESSVLTKAHGASLHALSLLFGQMLCGTLPVIVIALLIDGSPVRLNWTTRALLSIAYLAIVGTLIAFGLYYWLLKRVESTNAMTISLVTPLVAVVIGALWLNEHLTVQTFSGAALILLSIGILAVKRK